MRVRFIAILLTIVLLPSCDSAQTPKVVTEKFTPPLMVLDQKNIAYHKAVEEYILSQQDRAFHFDTLIIGNADLLDGVTFPEMIAGVRIVPLTKKISDTHPEKNEHYVLINIAWGDFEKDPVEFMMVTFFQDNHPQFNSYIYLDYDQKKSEYFRVGEIKLDNAYKTK